VLLIYRREHMDTDSARKLISGLVEEFQDLRTNRDEIKLDAFIRKAKLSIGQVFEESSDALRELSNTRFRSPFFSISGPRIDPGTWDTAWNKVNNLLASLLYRIDLSNGALTKTSMEQEMPSYDIAQICRNGHVTNAFTQRNPEHNQPYCETCGADTLVNCPQCSSPIRGGPREAFITRYEAPSYCLHCGHAFPWTETKLRAAQELAQAQQGLTQDERTILASSISELARETPATPVAASRVKTLLAKAGPAATGMFRELLVDIVSEAVRKMIFPA